jgi:hypothetical protein
MDVSTQTLSIISAVLTTTNAIIHLGGAVLAAILLIRRRTIGRWLILAGTAAPALSITCDMASGVTLPIALAWGSMGADVYVTTLTGIAGLCGGVGVLGYAILLIGIWLLAQEASEAEPLENE